MLRNVPPFIKLIWQTHKGFTLAMVLLRLVRSFVPVALLWVGKLIIDAVVAARGGALDSSHLWRLVMLEIGLALLSEVLSRVSSLSRVCLAISSPIAPASC